MKKMFVLMAVTIMSQFVFAQVQQDTASNKTGSGMIGKHHKGDRHRKSAIMQELNLSEDQKKQLKEMRIADKEKRETILNDSKLTKEQKQDQVQQLNKARANSVQSILTEEQKVKMKAAKEKMKAERKNDPERRHHKEMKERKTGDTLSTKQ